MLDVLQRHDWRGCPVHLGELFTLTKNKRKTRCVLQTHPLGWELRLFVNSQLDIVQSHVCRTQDEVLTTGEQWKTAMVEKGWS